MQEEPGESRAEGMCDWDMVSGAEKEMMDKLEKMSGCGVVEGEIAWWGLPLFL